MAEAEREAQEQWEAHLEALKAAGARQVERKRLLEQAEEAKLEERSMINTLLKGTSHIFRGDLGDQRRSVHVIEVKERPKENGSKKSCRATQQLYACE